MKERTIMIFPHFDNIEIIDNIRKQYDPLAELVRPHLTLVFPFKSDIKDETLANELTERLQGVQKFSLVLGGISKHSDIRGNYLFLNVVRGNSQIESMHNMLYEGMLSEFKSGEIYVPHMTIGKFATIKQMDDAYECIKDMVDIFQTIVDKVSVEMIGANGESIIELEIDLL